MSQKDRKAFINVPYRAYAGEPHWRPPLRMERAELLNPKKNPSLAHIDIVLLIARRGDEIAGRIAAFINHRHIEYHADSTGHFGLFDVITAEDDETRQALLKAASDWVSGKGMSKIAGPFDLSVNDECGQLLKGFDTPPSVLMPYGREADCEGLERAGFAKAMDMYALRHNMGDVFSLPPVVAKLKARCDADPSITVRPVNFARFEDDIALLIEIFNDAWSQNWGFIPLTDAEVAHMASSMRPVLRSDGLWIASIDGEPVSFTLMLPNLNEAIFDLNGRLLPFGWAKLLYRLKLSKLRTGRIPLAGTKTSVHKTRRGLTATVGAWDACLRAQHKRGIREVEFSWVLETNRDLLGLADIYQCERYKTYRIYEKAL